MTTKHELTDIQKDEIIALASHFLHTDIGTQLTISRQTVTDFLYRVKARQSTENISRPGRPRKTSETTNRGLIRNTESESCVPFKELKNLINLDTSTQTIHHGLQEASIRKGRAVKRPLLTKKHAKSRLEWARAHGHWTAEDWRKVI